MADKLHLRSEMRRPVYVQRLNKSIPRLGRPSTRLGYRDFRRSEIEALQEAFELDYMGNAMFEFGEVAAAVHFLSEQAKAGLVRVGEHRSVSYICPTNYEEAVKKFIETLLEDEQSLRLPEYCGLKDSLAHLDDPRTRTVGWLEIDNGFFLFIDQEMFEGTKRLLGIT